MKIFIDADGSPVVDIAVEIGKKFNLKTIIVKNEAHRLKSDYAEVVTVDISPDSADFYIFNRISKGDILISQDHGLIAMVLSKGAICINQNGDIFDDSNIDFILQNRHLSSKLRREKKIYTKIKKREPSMDSLFKTSLENIITGNI